MNNLNWDAIAHVLELIVVLPIAWKANRFFNRILNEREEYPPHRHVNGKILFPKGLELKKPQELE